MRVCTHQGIRVTMSLYVRRLTSKTIKLVFLLNSRNSSEIDGTLQITNDHPNFTKILMKWYDSILIFFEDKMIL